jgi:hypothetical protein
VYGMTQQEAAQATLTDEQMAALQNTLGAQIVKDEPVNGSQGEVPAESDLSGDKQPDEPESIPMDQEHAVGVKADRIRAQS